MSDSTDYDRHDNRVVVSEQMAEPRTDLSMDLTVALQKFRDMARAPHRFNSDRMVRLADSLIDRIASPEWAASAAVAAPHFVGDDR